MKNLSSLVVCLPVLFIVLCTKTRGIHLEASKESNYPLPGAVQPCDPEKCNTQCFDKYQNKPDPPGITETLLGGTCLGDDCIKSDKGKRSCHGPGIHPRCNMAYKTPNVMTQGYP
ncbi:hypothetical protein KY290_032504 [Solanum tuberosum]|uniref:Uncharacterized protein n=1 Tax=Solanum tuberosum TaxID=4113 RepID=A0ABQ7UDW3_SOLTU|nr:hypothetical protein KY284_031513 [Solanum tuberosum]KAH0654223.1 hypothetical protein KY289_031901 [Solanum tuberosum]KAH0656848.1 hypothetical protein KY285_031730 [Solanum tuberosum]KAH0744511.1 hypothetical protein KY290_032504 [Solanum tuberosum]